MIDDNDAHCQFLPADQECVGLREALDALNECPGEWKKGLPDKPGRYFYRDTEDYDYGIALVAWDNGHCWDNRVVQPELKLHNVCIWGSQHPIAAWNESTGENTAHPSWASCASESLARLEFWSEPITAPPGIPEVRGRPADIPQTQIDAEAERAATRSKKQRAAKRQAAKVRQQAIGFAKNHGLALYECDGCEALLHDADLVLVKERVCPNCDEQFIAEERNCPSCNRPFTRVENESMSCANCRDAGELAELTTLVKPQE